MAENINKLGNMLIEHQVITPEQLTLALVKQEKTKNRLGSTLIKLGFTTEEKITDMLAKQMGVTSIDITNYDINKAADKIRKAKLPDILAERIKYGR